MAVEASIWAPGETVNISANSKRAIETFIATVGQQSFTLQNFTYTVGTQSLSVFKNGKILRYGFDFGEVATNAFLLYVPCEEGDIVYAVGYTEISGVATTLAAADVTTSPHGTPTNVEAALTHLYYYRPVMAESISALKDMDLSGYSKASSASFYVGLGKGNADYYPDGSTGAASTLYADNSGFFDANGDGYLIHITDKLNVHAFGAKGDGATVDTTYVNNASLFLANLGGGTLFFSKGTYIGNYDVNGRHCVTFEGVSAGKLLVSTDMPTTFKAATAGNILSGTSTRGLTIKNIGFEGLGAATSLTGITVISSSWLRVIDCNFDNFADEAIYVSGGNSANIERCFAQNCVLDRSRIALTGVLRISGADHTITGGEYNPSLTAMVSSSRYICAIYVQGANHFFNGPVAEFGEAGLYIEANQSRFTLVRADLCWGHGIVNAGVDNTLSACQSINNGQELTINPGTYDGFYTQGSRNTYSSCIATSTVATKHRYGFNDTLANATVTNTYSASCLSFGHSLQAYNNVGTSGACFDLANGPERTLTADSATPDVDAYSCWRTANTVGTAYSNFLKNFSGQVIKIRVNDVNTTFVNGATLKTLTGATITGVSGKVYTFKCDNGIWFQEGLANTVVSSGATGGAASAGAGNQYVEIEVAGVKYKVLHDGTI